MVEPFFRRRSWHLWFALLFAMALLSVSGQAQEAKKTKETEAAAKDPKHARDGHVWCGLFVAHPKAAGETGDEEAKNPLITQLRTAFPDHATFRLIGENTESIFKEYECWIVPSRQLFLKIDSLGAHPVTHGGVHVHLQLWQQDHVLLKSDAILRESPVFIGGPVCGKGQLIMVLKLANDPSAEKAE